MKTKLTKITALVLTAAMVLGLTGYAAFSMGKNQANAEDETEGTAQEETNTPSEDVLTEALTETLTQMQGETEPSDSNYKDETVYVLTDANGGVQKVIVSDWIKNSLKQTSVSDATTLTNPQCVKGDVAYSMSDDNLRVWEANGEDFYYQGTSDKELPVSIEVTYNLDGKNCTAEELSGASGMLTISYHFVNNTKQTVSINDEDVEMYVPFVMLTGMLLDTDTYKNVTVSNGKLINDGSRQIVIGLALPGLAEDLALDSDKIDIPDTITVTAEVTNCKRPTALTLSTNEVFNKINTEELKKLAGDADTTVQELGTGLTQLLDGSSALYEGMETLLSKTEELIQGVDTLANGAAALKKGTSQIASGAADLDVGMKGLSDGLNQLTGNNEELQAGAKQVFETLLATADAQIAAGGLSADKLTIANYQTVLGRLIAGLGQMPESPAITAAIKSLQALLENLSSYEQFYQGVLTYTTGVESAKDGALELKKGTSALAAGSTQTDQGMSDLLDGINEFQTGTGAMVAGITELRDGSMQLSEGMQKMMDEGVGELLSYITKDVKGTAARITCMLELSKAYTNYSGIEETMEGSVKFIYKTE